MGRGINKNPMQGVINTAHIKGEAQAKAKDPAPDPVVETPIVAPVSQLEQPKDVTPEQQQQPTMDISTVELEKMYRTRERRTCKLQAAIPPSLNEALVAKAKERGLSMAETLICALRFGLPHV